MESGSERAATSTRGRRANRDLIVSSARDTLCVKIGSKSFLARSPAAISCAETATPCVWHLCRRHPDSWESDVGSLTWRTSGSLSVVTPNRSLAETCGLPEIWAGKVRVGRARLDCRLLTSPTAVVGVKDLAPTQKQWVPQHPTGHHAPAHQRRPCTHLQFKGLLTPNADGLANLGALARVRMLVGQLQHHRLAPIAPGNALS